jgi:hypothetical protein
LVLRRIGVLDSLASHDYPLTFLMDEQEDGQKFRGGLVELIEDHESKVEENPTRIKFRFSVNEDKAEESITCNKMLEYITRDEESEII